MHVIDTFTKTRRTTKTHSLRAMAVFEDNSSLDVSERNSMAIAVNIQSHTPFAVDLHLNYWSVLGTGRSENFTRDQFMSNPLRVNLLSRNIKRNRVPAHVNTTVYLDVIMLVKQDQNVEE